VSARLARQRDKKREDRSPVARVAWARVENSKPALVGAGQPIKLCIGGKVESCCDRQHESPARSSKRRSEHASSRRNLRLGWNSIRGLLDNGHHGLLVGLYTMSMAWSAGSDSRHITGYSVWVNLGETAIVPARA
jgi:hypothetical protein